MGMGQNLLSHVAQLQVSDFSGPQIRFVAMGIKTIHLSQENFVSKAYRIFMVSYSKQFIHSL